MSLKIRLKRVGKKKQPYYRLVVADSRKPRDGEVLERLGHYNPIKSKLLLKTDSKVIAEWMRKGAKPTLVAKNLLSKAGFFTWYEDFKKDPSIEALPARELILVEKPKKDRLKKNKNKAQAVAEEAEAQSQAPAAVAEPPKVEAKEEAPAPEVKKEVPAAEAKKEVPAEEAKEEKPEVKDAPVAEEAKTEDAAASEVKEEAPAEEAKEEKPEAKDAPVAEEAKTEDAAASEEDKK